MWHDAPQKEKDKTTVDSVRANQINKPREKPIVNDFKWKV